MHTNPEIVALARAMQEYEQMHGPRWASDLTSTEKQRWCIKAEMVAERLDALGYRLTFIPPEG